MTEFSYELVQGGIVVAKVTAPCAEDGLREIMHYAMMYAQDGPVAVLEPEGQDTLHRILPDGR